MCPWCSCYRLVSEGLPGLAGPEPEWATGSVPGSHFLVTLESDDPWAGVPAVLEWQGCSGLGAASSTASLPSRAEFKALFTVWEACGQGWCVLTDFCVSTPCSRDTARAGESGASRPASGTGC